MRLFLLRCVCVLENPFLEHQRESNGGSHPQDGGVVRITCHRPVRSQTDIPLHPRTRDQQDNECELFRAAFLVADRITVPERNVFYQPVGYGSAKVLLRVDGGHDQSVRR